MKLEKIIEKSKNFLFLLENKEDIKKKKLENLREKINEKISKLSKKIRYEVDQNEIVRLKNEKKILKVFKKELKQKREEKE